MSGSHCPYCNLPVESPGSHVHRAFASLRWEYGDEAFCYFADFDRRRRFRLPSASVMAQGHLAERFERMRGIDSSIIALTASPETLLIEEDVFEGQIPVAAWKLKYAHISPELVWSWFRETVRTLALAHGIGYAHGFFGEEQLFVSTARSGNGPPENSIRLVRFAALTGSAAMSDDLRNLAAVFRGLLPARSSARGFTAFTEVLADLESGEYHDGVLLWQTIEPYERLHQIGAAATDEPLARAPWKRRTGLLVLVLFLASLGVAWLSGRLLKDAPPPKRSPRQVAPRKKRVAPHVPIRVERYAGAWDTQFPLHWLSRLREGYLFVSRPLFQRAGFSLEELQTALGLHGKNPCAAGVDCLITFELDPRFALRRRTLISRRLLKERDGETLSPWRLAPGSDPRLRQGETPPALTGLSGELLTQTGYKPRETGRELLLLYWKLPPSIPGRTSLWVPLFGGVLPMAVLVRVVDRPRAPRLTAALVFASVTDSEQAAGLAQVQLKTLFGEHPFTLTSSGRRVEAAFDLTAGLFGPKRTAP